MLVGLRKWSGCLPLILVGATFACEGDDGRPDYDIPTITLDGVVQGEADLSRYYELVQMTGFKDALLAGSTITLLAPSNAALSAAQLPTDMEELSSLLRFHALGGTVDTQLLALGGEFRTVTGTTVRVTGGDAIAIFDSSGNSASIVKPDLRAVNGVVQIIDELLEPPPEGPAPPGKIPQELMEGGFTSLLNELTGVGLNTALDAAGPYTVFAPTDAAIGTRLMMADDDVVANVLMHHVVPGTQMAAALMANPTLTSVGKLPLVVAGGFMTVGGAMVGDMKDIAAMNGVIHKMNALILPPTIVEYVGQDMSMLGTTRMAITAATGVLGEALTPNTLMGQDALTFLAPSGMAWTTAGIDVGTTDTSTLAAIIRRHTLDKQYTVAELVTRAGMTAPNNTVRSLNGMLTVTMAAGVVTLADEFGHMTVIDATANDRRTLTGAVHVVNRLLWE